MISLLTLPAVDTKFALVHVSETLNTESGKYFSNNFEDMPLKYFKMYDYAYLGGADTNRFTGSDITSTAIISISYLYAIS